MMVGKNKGSARIVSRIEPGSVGVEIGVWRGDSSERFLTRARHLHLVDPWAVGAYDNGQFAGYVSRYAKLVESTNPLDFQLYYDGVYAQVAARFPPERVTIHRCTSAEFFGYFDQPVDFVYIDGDHTYATVLADLAASRRIIRPGGAIMGDDYGSKPDVALAVDRFIRESGLALELLGDRQYRIAV